MTLEQRSGNEFQEADCEGGGVVFLAGFLIVGAPMFAAEPNPGSPTHRLTSVVADQFTGAYLKTFWSTSNQFGMGRAWLENSRDGMRVFRLTFVGLDGKTLSTTATANRVEVVTSAGSFDIQTLPQGKIIERVSVRQGACQNQFHGGIDAAAVSATLELDAHGVPADSASLAQFVAAQKAFHCGVGSLAGEFHSFLAAAGVSLPSNIPGLNRGPRVIPSATAESGQVHAMVSQACADAWSKYAVALAALTAATFELNPFAITVGLAASEDAAKEVERACNI